MVYGACFGVELTLHNVAALYYHDRFSLDLRTAGLIAGLYGALNLFARSLGGLLSDRVASRWNLRARVALLAVFLLAEGLALMLFSRVDALPAAIACLLGVGLFVQMANGATFGIVPFISERALGSVAGIVGAGGNAGAVAAGLLFRSEGIASGQAFFILGACVATCSLATLLVRFPTDVEERERIAISEALVSRPRAGAEG